MIVSAMAPMLKARAAEQFDGKKGLPRPPLPRPH